MPTYTSKAGTVDDVIVQLGVNVSNTITGFTSEDFIFIEDRRSTSENARHSYDITRVGTDLVFKTVNLITDRVSATTTLKGAYSTDGLEFLTSITCLDGHFNNDTIGSVAILKNYTKSHEDTEKELGEMNWDNAIIVGTNSADILYGARTSFNSIIDGAGDDTIYGGRSNLFLIGSGNDTLTGGNGEDQYNFDRLSCFASKGKLEYTKTITNFDASDGDEIDLSRIAFNHKMLFTDARTSANWKRGDIIFEKNGSDGWLLGNTDKDKDPEIKIVLVGVTSFDANSSLDLSL